MLEGRIASNLDTLTSPTRHRYVYPKEHLTWREFTYFPSNEERVAVPVRGCIDHEHAQRSGIIHVCGCV